MKTIREPSFNDNAMQRKEKEKENGEAKNELSHSVTNKSLSST